VTLFLLLVAVVLVAVVAAVAAGRIRGGLEEPLASRPYRPLPEGPLTPDDVDAVELSVAFRGYRMDEVDALLDRLRDELARRDAELAALREPSGGGHDRTQPDRGG
jgi:DivIVA domain-containing protein